jgi:hypothetical protein
MKLSTLDFNNIQLLHGVIEQICTVCGITKITELEVDHLSQEIIIENIRRTVGSIIGDIVVFAGVASETPLEKVTRGIERYIGNTQLDNVYFSQADNICHDLEAFAPDGDVCKLGDLKEHLFLQAQCNNGQTIDLLHWLHHLMRYRQWPIVQSFKFYLSLAKREYTTIKNVQESHQDLR